MRVRILHKDGNRVVTLSRRKAIREKCLNCSNWNTAEVERCTVSRCTLYAYRMGHAKQDAAARSKAIRQYCLQCMNGKRQEVVLCPAKSCPLRAYRLSTLDRSVEIKSESCKGHLEAISGSVCAG